MAEPKDKWDIADIFLKAVIPVVVAITALLWNNQNTKQQTTASMTQIAIGVLSAEPNSNGTDGLRDWAIEVLQNPSNPPRLSEEAAAQLRIERLTSQLSIQGWTPLSPEALNDLIEEFKKTESNSARPLGDDLK